MGNMDSSIWVVVVTSVVTALITFAGVYLTYKSQIKKQQDDVEDKLWKRLKEEFDRISLELDLERAKRRELEIRVEKLEDENEEVNTENRNLKKEKEQMAQRITQLEELLG